MASAFVRNVNGSPAIVVDGRPYPPMMFTFAYWVERDPEELRAYCRRLGEAGMRLFYVCADTRWHTPGNSETGEPDGVEAAVRNIRLILDAVPEAHFLIRLNVSPPRDWVNAHPEEHIVFSDGKKRPVICSSVSAEPIDAMHSLCSENWRARGDEAIEDFLGALSSHAEYGRVIGVFLCAGRTDEWYYTQPLMNEDGSYGDFSEHFRREYEAFLRRKYGTVEELRRVWRRPDATFERPVIPTPAERAYVETADDKILRALRDWAGASQEIGLTIDMDARNDANVGVFLNANRLAYVADFYAAWHESTARTIVHFARTVKRIRPDLLVGAFYGSYGCTEFFWGGGSTGALTIMDSGAVDFLSAPGLYNNREPGGIVAQREMQDSFRLRNQIYICEDDARTHRSKPWMQREAMALYTVGDTLTTLKRDFARDLCEDVQGWWFDMGGDWYDDPDILALFRRQREIADFAYSLDRAKRNEIALVYDTESLHLVSRATDRLVLDLWRTADLGRIGAPVDYYFHNDLARPDMPDYKLYVMVHQFCLTDAEREAIYAKARRNHATILWMYAPGFINPGAERVMDLGNAEKTTGMKLGFLDRTIFPYFRVDPAAHPAVSLASATHRYGFIDSDVHSNIWIGSILPTAYLNPGFYIDDPAATVLGRYCADGRAALAMVERDGVRSVYCATPVMRSDLLASIAAYAGCHLFQREGDVLYANENFVAVHAKDDGRRTIRFKRPCSPFEVYEKRFYGHDVESIEVDMALGQTLMWSLAGPC